MTYADIAVLAGLALLFTGALLWARLRRKKGKSGCGGCAGCPYAAHCEQKKPPEE
ncbi:MAG: FeoB-associated Cys-rich membrane protein [Clostridia bacterium]|nr:FeoB-associated Cys-rich membrane protein [Clostridia bacterium]